MFHLIGDVLTHYWNGVQCKLDGIVKNQKLEGIVVGAVMRARDIFDKYVFMYHEEKDVALVISVNNYPSFWTVTCPNSTWAQCDCPMGMRGNIYKHHMKVFELFYCIVEETENIMGDSPMKEDVQGEEATEVKHDEEKIQILVMQNKYNANDDSVVEFCTIS